MSPLHFYATLEKGGVLFATVGLSVGGSVGLYTKCCLLNIFWPLYFQDQYHTWCRGYLQRVDDPYWFSRIRSHVQISRSNHSFELSVLSAQYLLKIFFSRTAGPISTKLGTDHPLVKGTQGLTNKDHSVIKKEMFFFPLQINVMILS